MLLDSQWLEFIGGHKAETRIFTIHNANRFDDGHLDRDSLITRQSKEEEMIFLLLVELEN